MLTVEQSKGLEFDAPWLSICHSGKAGVLKEGSCKAFNLEAEAEPNGFPEVQGSKPCENAWAHDFFTLSMSQLLLRSGKGARIILANSNPAMKARRSLYKSVIVNACARRLGSRAGPRQERRKEGFTRQRRYQGRGGGGVASKNFAWGEGLG